MFKAIENGIVSNYEPDSVSGVIIISTPRFSAGETMVMFDDDTR